MFKNALISVSDKTGLIEFIKPFVGKGLRVVSTGGTAEYLRAHQIPVIDVSEQTGFPEVMGGRVKTLHPHIHMPLLARSQHQEDFALLKEYNLEPFDLIICNLYPFAEALRSGKTGAELIEKIDIGGPTLLRAAAKNFDRVTVVCDPKDYHKISEAQELSLELRQELAGKVFSHVSGYDALIASSLLQKSSEKFSVSGEKIMDLRYGENPQQKAAWYGFSSSSEAVGLQSAKILQGKALSYNNLLDLDAATELVKQFCFPAAVIVKHNNPCGVAEHAILKIAVEKAIAADPVSAFGGIVAINCEIDQSSAEILSGLFLECVIAPSISSSAREIFARKKNLRVLEWPELLQMSSQKQIRSISGGFLIQDLDVIQSSSSSWTFYGEKPSEEILRDLHFGEKVCASLKSNAIAVVQGRQTKGLGMGQVNRVDAVVQALSRAQQNFGAELAKAQDLILVSDAFFPFPDSVEKAAAAGVKWILQPGGSIKDDEVVAVAKKLKVNMILSGERHFRH